MSDDVVRAFWTIDGVFENPQDTCSSACWNHRSSESEILETYRSSREGNTHRGLRVCRAAGAAAARFVPDFADAHALARDAAGDKRADASCDEDRAPDATATPPPPSEHSLSEPARRAAANLEAVISTLSRNFAEGRDYFKVCRRKASQRQDTFFFRDAQLETGLSWLCDEELERTQSRCGSSEDALIVPIGMLSIP